MFNYTFHWNQALKALPQLLDGAVVTLQIAILSMVIGVSCAIVLTLFRLSGNRILGAFASVWVEIARNTPALFQIYMAHFGLGNFGIHLSPYTALLVGIAFNNAGYLAVQRQERQVRRYLGGRQGALRHRLRRALHQPG